MFKEHKGSKAFNVNCSLAELIGFCATNNGGKQSEIAKGLRKDLKLHEEVYWQVCIYYFAKNKNWEDISQILGYKKPSCAPAAIGEICYMFDNRELAK